MSVFLLCLRCYVLLFPYRIMTCFGVNTCALQQRGHLAGVRWRSKWRRRTEATEQDAKEAAGCGCSWRSSSHCCRPLTACMRLHCLHAMCAMLQAFPTSLKVDREILDRKGLTDGRRLALQFRMTRKLMFETLVAQFSSASPTPTPMPVVMTAADAAAATKRLEDIAAAFNAWFAEGAEPRPSAAVSLWPSLSRRRCRTFCTLPHPAIPASLSLPASLPPSLPASGPVTPIAVHCRVGAIPVWSAGCVTPVSRVVELSARLCMAHAFVCAGTQPTRQ